MCVFGDSAQCAAVLGVGMHSGSAAPRNRRASSMAAFLNVDCLVTINMGFKKKQDGGGKNLLTVAYFQHQGAEVKREEGYRVRRRRWGPAVGGGGGADG